MHGIPKVQRFKPIALKINGSPWSLAPPPEGERPTTRAVVGSNFCDVTVVSDPRAGRAVCVSALDNLGKGGSANGIQNLNIMMGWDERTGLEAPPVYP